MSLSVVIAHEAGEFKLQVELGLGSGLTALVGPSGSGKTTILNVIAGVTKARHAVVKLGGDVLVDTSTATWVPPHLRRIGYVFQEPRLFEHLKVRQNLMYGRWFTKPEADELSPDDLISLLNLGGLVDRRPSRLSGGEKQRVALGRALLSRPRLLLLDEPLAAVDQQHRTEILPYLDRVRDARRIPTIYVTHTWAEIADRAEHVVRLENGRVLRAGSSEAATALGTAR